MRTLIIIPFLLFWNLATCQNLVPNYSFEVYDTCPDYLSQLYRVADWHAANNSTPDYFNQCASLGNNVYVPNNQFGFQYSSSGVGYCGFHNWGVNNYREPIQALLTSPLTIGTKYFISFNVNLADGGVFGGRASDKMGARFTNHFFSSSNPAPVDNFAHIYSHSIISDTSNWVTIQGSFIADSAYMYILIGNFFDNANTDTLHLMNPVSSEMSYYYVDDICVSVDSMACSMKTNVQELRYNEDIKIYPNPSTQFLTLEFENINLMNHELLLFDQQGQLIRELTTETSDKITFNTSQLTKGLYLIQLITEGQVRITKKIIVD
jgi:hypothetical protein